MTEAIGGAAQAQSIVDTMTQKVPGRIGGNANRTDARIGHARDGEAKDNETIERADAPSQEPRDGEHAVRRASTQTVAKSARRDNRESEKDSDEKSFAATIDGLGKGDTKTRTKVATDVETGDDATDATDTAPQTAKNGAVSNGASTPAWTAFLTLRHIDLHHTIDGSSAGDTPLAANSVGAGTSADVAKLQGIMSPEANLLAASATDKQPASGADKQVAFPEGTDESAINTPIVVNARQTHWLFAAPATANTQGQTSADKMAKATVPMTPLDTTAQTKGQDDITKSLSNALNKTSATPESPVAVAATSDANSRQPFDGERKGGDNAKPHDQTLANIDSRKALDVSAAKPASRILPDAGDMSASTPSLTQQVRTGVVDALAGDATETTPASAPQALDPRPAATAQVLRTIDLTLSPPDLGTIRLRLSLKSNALDIDAETSKASTAKLLDDDRKGLEQSLRDAGFDVSSLKIADAGASANTGMNNQTTGNSPFQDPSQARANFAGRQGGNLQQGNGSTPNQSQHRPRGDNPQTSPGSDGTASRQSNAIYI